VNNKARPINPIAIIRLDGMTRYPTVFERTKNTHHSD
jgi:hypothetical protein